MRRLTVKLFRLLEYIQDHFGGSVVDPASCEFRRDAFAARAPALLDDRLFRRRVIELESDLTALEFTELRTLAQEAKGKGPGAESSLLKIKGTEIQQRISELVLEAAGPYAAPYFRGFAEGSNAYPIGPAFAHQAAPTYFNMRKTTIYGGSNEIQRNIIAKMILGL